PICKVTAGAARSRPKLRPVKGSETQEFSFQTPGAFHETFSDQFVRARQDLSAWPVLRARAPSASKTLPARRRGVGAATATQPNGGSPGACGPIVHGHGGFNHADQALLDRRGQCELPH